ncbi:hypothetical protein ACLEEJ_00265 [Lonsdalea quercina]|uniref:hypothetical protein n=1 Tax=Lonsdalea quercina TaxID=71657 RepID=UPI003975DE90
MENKIDIIESLCEELVIAKGIIKEICAERDVPLPNSSLQRMERAIEGAREYMRENI